MATAAMVGPAPDLSPRAIRVRLRDDRIQSPRRSTMKYALLIYDTPNSWETIPAEDRAAVLGEYMALRADERCVDGAQLHPVETATTVQVQDGRSLTTDGPFADT